LPDRPERRGQVDRAAFDPGLHAHHVGRDPRRGRDVTRMPAQRKLRDAGIAYVLQDNSVFPT
jgi:hypothetical protein